MKAVIKLGVPLAVVIPLAQQEKPRQERMGQEKRFEISILPGPQRGSAQTETDPTTTGPAEYPLKRPIEEGQWGSTNEDCFNLGAS